MSPKAKATTFYLITVGLCSAVALALRSQGQLAAVIAMLTPAVAVLLMQLVVTRDGYRRSGWSGLGVTRRPGVRLATAALVLPLGILGVSEAVLVASGLTDVHLPGLPGPLDLADLLISLVVVGAFVFAEEVGWRGYLLPLLVADGRPAPGARVGLLHGIFHLPIVFLASDAYLTEGSRWITVPVFLGVLTASGPIYAWLRQASGSVWPAVMAR